MIPNRNPTSNAPITGIVPGNTKRSLNHEYHPIDHHAAVTHGSNGIWVRANNQAFDLTVPSVPSATTSRQNRREILPLVRLLEQRARISFKSVLALSRPVWQVGVDGTPVTAEGIPSYSCRQSDSRATLPLLSFKCPTRCGRPSSAPGHYSARERIDKPTVSPNPLVMISHCPWHAR